MAGTAVPPPPRALSVQKFAEARATELRSLHTAVSDRLSGDLRLLRRDRRRTTGHLPSKRRRGAAASGGGGGCEEEKKVSRRVRRRRELSSNPALGFVVAAGDGTRRLRTHLWHAKRFEMGKRWEFRLPLGILGRGRGSRAVFKWLRNGAVVHDASYFIPVRLEGPEDSLLSIMRMVLHPCPPEKSAVSEYLSNQVVRGVCYANAMLWHAGPDHPHIIGPVMYMWRPFLRDDSHFGAREGDLSNACTNSSEDDRSSSQCQLWIWIHPATFEEGFDALKFACQKQMDDSDGAVSCCSLEGHIARLEVMGAKALQLLKKILHPINEVPCSSNTFTSENPTLNPCTSTHLQKAFALDHAEHLQSHAILSLKVCDPREVSSQEIMSSPKLTSTSHEKEFKEEVLTPNLFADGILAAKGNMLSSMWLKPGRHDVFLSDSKELWDSSHQIDPPVAESVLCTEKHHRRLKFFHLDSRDHQGQMTNEKDCFSRSCPIILLKHANGVCSTGWSIILPLSWLKPFWLCLISHGAHAIGLRERRWVASKNNLPSFPYDNPDSKAYSSFMADEATAFDKAAELRPAAVRPSRVPIPPPWHCIACSVDKGDTILRGLESDGMEQSVALFPESSPIDSDTRWTESSLKNDVASSQIFIPRTLETLRRYLKEVDRKYLAASGVAVIEEGISVANDIDQLNVKTRLSGNELCLVRVLLRAFKEGSFEDGAIVCAPILSDISAWKDRSKEEEEEWLEKWELQLPQSYVGSYFMQLGSGKWELRLPADHMSQQSFRWPIGFVTTGFVHGISGREAVAVAFCEAKLLAMLRRQQWTQAGFQRQEIFVLVRNMRSTAYRRALATIVLEQQKEDLGFM